MKRTIAAMLLLVMTLSCFAGASAYADETPDALFDSGDYEAAFRTAEAAIYSLRRSRNARKTASDDAQRAFSS